MIAVDLFAGGGGASQGIAQALGVAPKVAINHDETALEMHAANHPGTMHLCKSVFDVAPFRPGGPVDLLWASPDCTDHSRAKGGKPREKGIRDLAWVVIDWAKAVAPRVICVENVQEFTQWGPLDEQGHPIKHRRGETFKAWCAALRGCGYRLEHRLLNAADYGAPTSRVRFFFVARCDGLPIRWPEPTHGPGRPHPHRPAADCIDWSLPCPSIFLTKEDAKAQGLAVQRPLADATLRRIAAGVRRFVLEAPQPFLVRYNGDKTGQPRTASLDEPLPTVTTEPRFGLVAPFLATTSNGERKTQAPRVRDIERPLGTVCATGSQGALVAAFLAKNYGGPNGHQTPGSSLRAPLGTVTARDHHSLVAAFLCKYYQEGTGQRLDEPLHTITTRERFGLVEVEVEGERFTIADIGMRMLTGRELARAHGFADSYVLPRTKADQVAAIGNSVPPPVVEALVAAQFGTISSEPSQLDLFARCA